MEVTVPSSHIVSAAPSSSGVGLITLLPCSSMGSLPQETALQKLLQCECFTWATVLCLRGHKSCHQLVPVWTSHEATPFLEHHTALVWGPPLMAGGSLPPMDLQRLQGHSCFSMGCTMGCRGVSALAPGAPLTPPLPSVIWVAAGLFLSHIFTPLCL